MKKLLMPLLIMYQLGNSFIPETTQNDISNYQFFTNQKLNLTYSKEQEKTETINSEKVNEQKILKITNPKNYFNFGIELDEGKKVNALPTDTVLFRDSIYLSHNSGKAYIMKNSNELYESEIDTGIIYLDNVSSDYNAFKNFNRIEDKNIGFNQEEINKKTIITLTPKEKNSTKPIFTFPIDALLR